MSDFNSLDTLGTSDIKSKALLSTQSELQSPDPGGDRKRQYDNKGHCTDFKYVLLYFIREITSATSYFLSSAISHF